MSGDSGDELSQSTRRRRKVVLRASSDSDSSFETIRLGRRKRLRVVASDDDSTDSGDSSGSLLVVDASSRRTLPQLRYEDESSSSSGWESEQSDHAKISISKSVQEKPKQKQTKDGCGSDSSDGNSEKCPICLLSFHDQEIGTPENCEHIFCVDCITEWSKNVNTCPVDRMNFDSIIVRRCIGGRVLRKIAVVVKQVPEEAMSIREDPTHCEICGSSEREESMLLCDFCDLGYHMQCLTPPINEIPVGEWFCPHCANGRYADYQQDIYLWGLDIAPQTDGESSSSSPSSPRPTTSSRVSQNNRRSMRLSSSQQRNMDEPSTSGTSQRSLQAVPSTSRRQTAGNSRVPTTRRRKTRRRTRRTRTVVVEYEMKDGNKFPIKKKVPVKKRVKRKKVKKRRAPRTVARRSLVRASVRARLATLQMSGTDTSLTIAGVDHLTLSRYKAGIPALNILGTGNELDYFSDDEDVTMGDGPNAVATRRQTTSQAIQDLRQTRRKMIGISQPATTVSGVDILSGIIQSQTLLHSKNTKVSINSDGTLKIDKKPQKNTKNENESVPDKTSDAKLDLTKVDDAAKKTPAYGGTSRGGGNWNGNRGGFSRDQNSYNNRGSGGGSYSNNGGNDGYQGGGNTYRGNYQGSGNYSGDSNFQNSNPWQSNPNLRSGPDGGNLMDLNRRQDQNTDRRDQFPDRRNQLPDRRDIFFDRREFPDRREQFTARQDQFLERRDQFIERRDPFLERRDQFPERHDASSERRDPLTDRPPDHNSMLHHAMLNAGRELHTNAMNRDMSGPPPMLGRASLGVPWQPFATPPINPGNTMARHSFGGFDNSDPLDMTVGQNTHTQGDVDDREIDIYGDIHEAPVQPEVHTHIEPLPEPPVFRFDLKPMLSEDEKSDSGLVIDTEKYDPMDPTNDESSSDEDGRKRGKGDPNALVGSFMKIYNEELLPTAENSEVIVPPKILDAAVQQVLTQVHRDMIRSSQSHESDGDDSEGDCPNYSIYSAASLNIANNNESTIISNDNLQSVDEHEEKEEDLIQQEDDAPDSTVNDEIVTFKEPVPLQRKEEIKKSVEEDKLDEKVSKRCPITPNKRTAIKIKLNTAPILIKRHVLDLYADEDELMNDQEKIFDKPPLAADNLIDKSAKEDSESKDDKIEEQTELTGDFKKVEESGHEVQDINKEGHSVTPENEADKVTPENEAPDRLSLEDVSPGKVTSDDEYSEKEDAERVSSDPGSPEKVSPLMTSEKVSPKNCSPESESPKKVSREKKSPELDSSVKKLPENNSSVTEICNNNLLKTDLIDKNTEKITQGVPETSNKMTDSISGSEDERSYTPCLDENKSKETSFETDQENILEALGTEMISEDEENEIFSDHSDKVDSVGIEKPEDKKEHTDKELTDKENIDKENTDKEHTYKEHTDKEHSDKDQTDKEHTEVTLLADKKKKKKKIDRDGKDKAKLKGKKVVDIPFKKLSKSGKERNYRDKDDKNKSKRRRSDEKDREIRSAKEKRKEKRKDLERYDVRNVVSDKKRKVKDPFGRDTSRPRSNSLSLSRTPSPASFTARNRSVSLPRYTPSLGRCRSPPHRSISRKLPSPRRSPSPRNRKLFSPIPRSPSPRRKRITSPRGPSRKRKSVSPRRRSVSPRVRRSVSPRRRKSFSPKLKKSISLRRGQSISHRGRKSPSHTRKSMSPVKRRRSTSRGRKRVHRSPSAKPRKKLSRKSRSRLRSSSRRRSPKGKKSRRTKQLSSGSRRRKSPKGKKTKQRSVTPVNNIPHSPVRPMGHGGQQHDWQKSPAYHEDWSSDSPSLNSRMLSPGWTPPRGETPERRNLRVIVTNNPKDKRKREKRKRAKDLEAKNQHEGPSKEVFTSGNNILVSVNFNQQDDRNPSPPPEDPRKRKRESKKDKTKEKTKRRRKKDNETSNAKPIAIIDLDKSPFREITPSPKNVIVLSDSEHEEKEEELSNRPPLLRGEADISSGKENAATSAHNSSFQSTGGPKTPPEPSVKFSIMPNVNPQLRAVNPLHEDEEEEDENDNVDNATSQPGNKDSHKGPNTPPDPPNTPPSSPDAYDPFEPTKSGSASPEQSESKETNLSNKPDLTMTLESAQNANLSADDVVNARPITPIEKVMALLKSTQNVSPTDPNEEEQAVKELQQDVETTNGGSQSVQADNTIAVLINKTAQPISHFSAVIKPNSPKPTYSTVAPTVTSSAPLYLNAAIPRIGAFSGTSQSPVRNSSIQHTSQRIVLPSPTKSSPLRTQPNKLFLAKPSPIKSTPIKPMPSKTIISKLPLPSIKPISRKHRMEIDDYDMGVDDYMGMDSPYSPGSSDFGDLFEPPTDKSGKSSYSKTSTTKDIFDNLFGSSKNSKSKIKSTASKVPVKQLKKKGKTQTVGVKMDDENLKIMDDLPSSAVEMQVKSKFLNKLNRQSRVVEEVKLVLKPHYNKKHVTKEQYKDILRSAVPKICHNRNGEINPAKIQLLVEAYVKKYRKRKHKNV